MVPGAVRPILDGLGSLSRDVLAPTIGAAPLRQCPAHPLTPRLCLRGGSCPYTAVTSRPIAHERMTSNGTRAGQDWYGNYTSGTAVDPADPSSGSYRVFRGGSWINTARNCQSARRNNGAPGRRTDALGFRLLRMAP
jgi:hypothetical protein